MIGFARKLANPARTIEPDLAQERGEPPEGFVEKISHEGGDVYVAPLLESLRAALKRRLNPSDDEPEERTPRGPTGGAP